MVNSEFIKGNGFVSIVSGFSIPAILENLKKERVY